ncbi:carbamoyltransferase [Kutzneria buriramensis]|uniref:Carbamoyltransferase n=2 Tax=Kutzneria buriramensis TaxID=1045776 RepID=A0A3E0H2Y6_9PSEU|nr:carbamoyltransferase [Kutzneria buriramensis]
MVLGISGLPNAQRYLARSGPDPLDERICQGLDSAAALVVDGVVVAAAAEERFSGVKGTGALPVNAIDYVLREAGVSRDDVDAIAHGFDYDGFRRVFARQQDYFAEVLSGRTVIDALTEAGWRDVERRFRPVTHHVAHAASAYLPSGFGSALCVVSDGMGETEALSVYRARDGRLDKVHSQPISDSLGLLYSICTRFLGFQFNSDEYKVMGLAAYGDPARNRSVFDKLVSFDPESGGVRVNWPRGSLADAELGYPHARAFLAEGAGFTPRVPDGQVHPEEADFAAALQAKLTGVLADLVAHWMEKTGERDLCLAGGTFLNCKSNQILCDLPGVDRVFVQPAAGDDGSALGAALHVAGSYAGSVPFNPYTGPSYAADEVGAELERRADELGLAWRQVGLTEEYFALAAEDIAADRVIAWFHDRMEWGPRALGNRSILALPKGDRIKERINGLIKFREPFRPFAPAVFDADCATLFETPAKDPVRYMLCTARVREEHRESVAGIVHADGTARIQLVRRDLNEKFWTLLSEVKQRTGVGCVVNTSFNVKGQPLIMAPGTALDTFTATSLSRLYIEGFVVWKKSQSS